MDKFDFSDLPSQTILAELDAALLSLPQVGSNAAALAYTMAEISAIGAELEARTKGHRCRCDECQALERILPLKGAGRQG
jgi:hypothetical protein